MVFFPVVMYGWESWTINKAEHQRIDAFEEVVLEKTLESLLDCKEIQPVHSERDQSWVFIGRTDVEVENPVLWPPDAKLTHLKRPWCCKRLREGGEGDDRGWDGRMASLTQWAWIWVTSGSWWWTGRPGMLWSTELQRVRHYWTTLLNWTVKYVKRIILMTANQLLQVYNIQKSVLEKTGRQISAICLNARDTNTYWFVLIPLLAG